MYYRGKGSTSEMRVYNAIQFNEKIENHDWFI